MNAALAIVAALGLSSLLLNGQKAPSANTASKAAPLAPCETLGNAKSCRTFNAMLLARDDEFSDLQRANTETYVCFNGVVDMFYRISFGTIPAQYFSDKSLPGDGLNSGLIFDSFASGKANAEFLSRIRWTWEKDNPASAVAIMDSTKEENKAKAVSIDSTRLFITVSFLNSAKYEVVQKMEIRRLTGGFSIHYDADRAASLADDEGSCVHYPQ